MNGTSPQSAAGMFFFRQAGKAETDWSEPCVFPFQSCYYTIRKNNPAGTYTPAGKWREQMKKTDRRSREQIVEPLNPTPEFMTMGNGFHQITSYGALIVGEKGFEYYNERTLKDFIQIPWEELDLIIGSIYFGGRFIPRIAFRTKNNGTFVFSCRKPHAFLRACREHFPAERIVRSKTLTEVMGQKLRGLFRKDDGMLH